MTKIWTLIASSLLSLGLTGVMPALGLEPADDPPPPHKKKGNPKKDEPARKGESGPAGDLRKAYELLRRIKADDGPSGRTDERLRDWTERAAKLYRKGVQAHGTGDPRLAHEYGTAAHDLARAVDHARNAARFDRADPDLPPPPEGPGPGGDGAEARRDLRHAYDRIRELEETDGADAKFYLDGARDLYNAARRDVQGDRHERGGELAKAAEALTHVPEHLEHADELATEPGKGDAPKPKPKKKADRPEAKEKKADRPEPKEKKGERPELKEKKADRPDNDDDLPPALTPRD